jgi:RNA polymerase sigma-70 factor (ECF subfamily)
MAHCQTGRLREAEQLRRKIRWVIQLGIYRPVTGRTNEFSKSLCRCVDPDTFHVRAKYTLASRGFGAFLIGMGIDFQEKARWLARNLLPYEPMLRSRLRHMFLHGLEVDDIIQETYARIVSQPALEAIRHPHQYASQTATAIVIDHVRRSRVVSITAVGNLDQLEIAALDASPEQRLEFREDIAEVAHFLAQLPERTREVLIMRRVEGLSQQETANRLGISEKTVEKHMVQGVAALMALFGRGGKTKSHPSKPKRADGEHEYKTIPPED